MQLSWGSFSDGQRASQFQICGRLLSSRNDDVIIETAIKSFEAHTPKPYLQPMNRFFLDLNSAQIWEIPVGGWCGCVARSPCGRYVAAGAGPDIVIADPISGDILKRLKGHTRDVRCITFAAGLKKIVSASEDKNAAVWEWEKSDAPLLVLKGHSDSVTGVDISRDGEFIVSGASDGSVRLWNGFTGLQSAEFALGCSVSCARFCSEDNKVAIGLDNGVVKVLDRFSGDTVFEDNGAHTGRVPSVTFSSDGRRMATGSSDKTIRIWDAETWTGIGSPIERHTREVTSVAFSPDGRQLVSGSHDGTIRLWNVLPAEVVGAFSNRPVLSEANVFSSDMVNSVRFTGNGERIVSGSIGGFVRIWDAAFVCKEKQRRFGHSASVLGVCISPDGQRVATGSLDKTVCLWDTKTGAQIGTALNGHTDGVACVCFSPSGRYLVSASGDNTMRMWDTMHFTQFGIPFEGHSGWVNCVSFSSDGLRIASGGADKTIRLWNVLTRQQLGDPLIGHSNEVEYISESSDGVFVVSRGKAVRKEREAIIWNLNSGAIVWRSKENNSGSSNRITHVEAESIIRSCVVETRHLWPTSFPDYTTEIFCDGLTLHSNLQGEEISHGVLPSYSRACDYDDAAKVFVAGLESGGVAICRFVE